jgi:hypothetical protein
VRAAALKLTAHKPPPAPPLAERGRMLLARDVQELIGKKPDGKWRRSLWWIRYNFAPDAKRYLGRDAFWWESEALAWLDAQRGAE